MERSHRTSVANPWTMVGIGEKKCKCIEAFEVAVATQGGPVH